MVVEVNKLIANLLLSEHAVSIPGVGSLRAVRQPAVRLSRRRIRPAYYALEFSSDCAGTSLADAIAAAARCDAATAQDACARWLGRTMADGVLTIRGVGVLRNKSFAVDPAFEKLLNPQGREPLVVRKPGTPWMLWAVAAVAIVCGVGVCGWIVYDRWASGGFERMGTLSADAGLSDHRGATDVALADAVRIPEGAEIGAEAAVGNGVGSAAGSNGGEDRAAAISATAAAGSGGASDNRSGINDRTPIAGRGATVGEAGSYDRTVSQQGTVHNRKSDVRGPASATAAGSGGTSGVRAGITGPVPAAENGTATGAAGTNESVSLQNGTRDHRQEKFAKDGLAVERLVSGRTYVVLGVYSTEQNARRAARQASDADPALQPALYFYGPKFMLSVFEADDPADCAAFVRAHVARFPDAWCYTAR